MKNALLYCVNNNKWNKTYLHQMVNSINSFYANNPKSLTDTITVFILTDKKEGLDLSKLNSDAKDVIVIEESEFSYDYSTMPKNTKTPHITFHAYFRWEMFGNSVFNDFDNILYLDCDTEVVADVSDIFVERVEPIVGMVRESRPLFKLLYNREDLGHYYNSGVMVVTPKLIGTENMSELFQNLVKLAKENNYIYSDQCALNFALKDDRFSKYECALMKEYNSFFGTWDSGIQTKNPKIIHHAGNKGAKFYPLRYIV